MKISDSIIRMTINVVIIAGLLLLDWAALHDIMNHEENPVAEYLMLISSIIVFGLMFILGLKFRAKK